MLILGQLENYLQQISQLKLKKKETKMDRIQKGHRGFVWYPQPGTNPRNWQPCPQANAVVIDERVHTSSQTPRRRGANIILFAIFFKLGTFFIFGVAKLP